MKTDQITLYSINRLLHCPSNYKPSEIRTPEVLDHETHNSISSCLFSDLSELGRNPKRTDATYFRSLDAAADFLKGVLDRVRLYNFCWSAEKITAMGYPEPVSWCVTSALPVKLLHTQESYSTGSLRYELVFSRTIVRIETGRDPVHLPPHLVAFVVEPHTFTIADLP